LQNIISELPSPSSVELSATKHLGYAYGSSNLDIDFELQDTMSIHLLGSLVTIIKLRSTSMHHVILLLLFHQCPVLVTRSDSESFAPFDHDQKRRASKQANNSCRDEAIL